MKKTRILSLLMLTMFSINTVSAQVVNISSGLNYSSNSSDKTPTYKDKLHIATTITKDFDSSSIDAAKDSIGTVLEGPGGFSLGMGYLTPDIKFGYIAINGLNLVGMEDVPPTANYAGTIVAYSDPLGKKSTPWNLGANSKYTTFANQEVYSIGASYFTNSVASTINNVDISKLDNYLVQTNPTNGRRFVATTLYTRWYYDTNATATGAGNTNKAYFHSDPILRGNVSGGPYLAINNYLDIAMDVEGPNGITYRNQINENPNAYLISVSKLKAMGGVGLPDSNSDWAYLTYDYPFKRTDFTGTKVQNKKAVLEKRIEYRRYISEDSSDENYSEKYEYVYAYEKQTVNTKSSIPTKQPQVSISVSSKSPDTNGAVSKYSLTTTIVGLNQTYNSPSDPKEYTVYDDKDSSAAKNSLKNEPKENEMDIWHRGVFNKNNNTYSNLVGKVTFTSPDGSQSFTLNQNISEGRNVVTEFTSQYGDLSNWTVKLDVQYTLHNRYMYEKIRYTDTYKKDKNDSNYMSNSQVKEYIMSLSNSGSITYGQKIDTFQSSILRTTTKYKTDVYGKGLTPDDVLVVSARTYIPVTNYNSIKDSKKPVVSVIVDPKNPTTQLENGEFSINGLINGMEPTISEDLRSAPSRISYSGLPSATSIPSGERRFSEWHDDIEVTKFQIIAPDGEKWVDIDTSKGDAPITAQGGRNVVDVILSKQHLSAKPTQVGVATIIIEYNYTYNYRTETEVSESSELVLDSNGNLVPKDYTITYETFSYSSSDRFTTTFNIYSITGATVN